MRKYREEKSKQPDSSLKVPRLNSQTLIVVGVYYFGIFALYGALVVSMSAEPAKFGDMFGGFNAFVAGLGFIGVIYTIRQQQKQMAMQAERNAGDAEDARRQIEISSIAIQLQMLHSHMDARWRELDSLLDDIYQQTPNDNHRISHRIIGMTALRLQRTKEKNMMNSESNKVRETYLFILNECISLMEEYESLRSKLSSLQDTNQ